MSYRRETYDYAMSQLEIRRSNALSELTQHREEVFRKVPQLTELEKRISSTGFSIYRIIMSGNDVADKIKKLEEENLQLNKQFIDLLVSNGFPSDYLEIKYYCDKCQDTGFVNGQQCTCLKDLLKQEASRKLNSLTPMKLCTFDSFKLDYYPDNSNENGMSPRERMRSIYNYCKKYADEFSLESPSIIMQGATGLGKTHLSLAIAKSAIDLGHDVIYGSSYNLLNKIERERFGRDEDNDSYNNLLECDLLILDDLGTEYTSAYISATIYSIINTRLLSSKPTIISTNLSMEEMLERYSDRIVSRILGSYERLVFVGKDIRLEKIKRNM